jgi:hypothetical protein
MMIAVALIGVGIWAIREHQRHSTYYAAGWWDAELELWRGDASIYTGGGLVMGDRTYFDIATGLPTHMRSGCVQHIGDSEWVSGHNDHITQYIRWHGLPKNSLGPWLPELLNLYRYFEITSRTRAPLRLMANGPALVSPEGRFSVRLAAVASDNKSPDEWLSLDIVADNTSRRTVLIRPARSVTDLLWGPPNSPFVVIRSVIEKTHRYEAYDLRTGRRLNAETWDDWRRGWELARAKPFEYRVPVADWP